MLTVFKKMLLLPGVHFLTTRYGPLGLRKRCFDEKFSSGQWCFRSSSDSELVQIIENYACGRAVLMLGCGTGSVAGALNSEAYSSFTGVDLSPVAISIARKQANSRVIFEVADMENYECAGRLGVILFSESLYYVKPLRRERLLRRLQGNLSPGGNFVVTIADPGRYRSIVEMIRGSFEVIEDRRFVGSPRHLLVFH